MRVWEEPYRASRAPREIAVARRLRVLHRLLHQARPSAQRNYDGCSYNSPLVRRDSANQRHYGLGVSFPEPGESDSKNEGATRAGEGKLLIRPRTSGFSPGQAWRDERIRRDRMVKEASIKDRCLDGRGFREGSHLMRTVAFVILPARRFMVAGWHPMAGRQRDFLMRHRLARDNHAGSCAPRVREDETQR